MAIALLDSVLIDKIAAGEVVERPASVVKELVENSIDAGATVIEVSLRAGGRDLIRVVDNGSGMTRDDAQMCLQRHATSKIRTAEDLAVVGTLGFRGEAIPSVASVSRFRLETRPEDAETGTAVEVEGGELKAVRDGGGAAGTEIDVRDLFFNIPVRRKFLRTVQTELKHCVEAVSREIAMRPEVDITLLHDGKAVLRHRRASTLRERVAQLLDEPADRLQEVRWSAGGVEVRGFIAPLSRHRGGATGAQYLHVNGRYVRDPVLKRAVAEAVAGQLPKGRHPVLAVDVRLDPHRVDVNAHPAKTEVRFREPREVASALSMALRRALADTPVSRPPPARGGQGALWSPPRAEPRLPLPAHPGDDPRVRDRADTTPSPAAAPSPVRPSTETPMRRLTGADLLRDVPNPAIGVTPRPRSALVPTPSAPLGRLGEDRPVAASPPVPRLHGAVPVLADMRVAGQLGLRWLVLDDGESTWWVSILEARSALLLESIHDPAPPRRCAPTVHVTLDRSAASTLERCLAEVESLGFAVRDVRPGEWRITNLPSSCPQTVAAEGLLAVLSALSRGDLAAPALARTIAAATLDPLTQEEVRGLLVTLDATGHSRVAKQRSHDAIERWLR